MICSASPFTTTCKGAPPPCNPRPHSIAHSSGSSAFRPPTIGTLYGEGTRERSGDELAGPTCGRSVRNLYVRNGQFGSRHRCPALAPQNLTNVRTGSKCEELALSICCPLYPRYSPSKRTFEIGRCVPKATHAKTTLRDWTSIQLPRRRGFGGKAAARIPSGYHLPMCAPPSTCSTSPVTCGASVK